MGKDSTARMQMIPLPFAVSPRAVPKRGFALGYLRFHGRNERPESVLQAFDKVLVLLAGFLRAEARTRFARGPVLHHF